MDLGRENSLSGAGCGDGDRVLGGEDSLDSSVARWCAPRCNSTVHRYYWCRNHDRLRGGGEQHRCPECNIGADALDSFISASMLSPAPPRHRQARARHCLSALSAHLQC